MQFLFNSPIPSIFVNKPPTDPPIYINDKPSYATPPRPYFSNHSCTYLSLVV